MTATDHTNAAHASGTATGAASPLTIGGLTNGDRYSFTVTATNTVGTGPASAASNIVVPLATLPVMTTTTTMSTTTTVPGPSTSTGSPLPLTGGNTAIPVAAAAGLLIVALDTRRLRRRVDR